MILEANRVKRVYFDPKNKEHLASLKHFIQTGSWGNVKFMCEGSYISVPEYVMRKYIAHQLKCADAALTKTINLIDENRT